MALPRSRPRKNSASMLEKKCSQLTWRKPLVSRRHHSPWSSTAGASMPPSRISKLDVVFDSDPALAAATRNATRLTAAMRATATSDDSRFCRRTPAMFAGSGRREAVRCSSAPAAALLGVHALALTRDPEVEGRTSVQASALLPCGVVDAGIRLRGLT